MYWTFGFRRRFPTTRRRSAYNPRSADCSLCLFTGINHTATLRAAAKRSDVHLALSADTNRILRRLHISFHRCNRDNPLFRDILLYCAKKLITANVRDRRMQNVFELCQGMERHKEDLRSGRKDRVPGRFLCANTGNAISGTWRGHTQKKGRRSASPF